MCPKPWAIINAVLAQRYVFVESWHNYYYTCYSLGFFPKKQDKLNHFCLNARPRSTTMAQHWHNNGSTTLGFLSSLKSFVLACNEIKKMKWICFRPFLCTYRLNWARRTFWRWWDEWDDTALETQDSKFKPWRSEVEHATSRSQRLSTMSTV